MKKITLVLIIFAGCPNAFSQGLIKITAGTTVKSNKSVYLVSSKMNILTNGTLQLDQNAGTLKLTGNTDDSIAGNGTVILNRLQISKNSGTKVNLQKNISVSSECVFATGNLNLDNYEIDLGNNGALINESEINRAYTNGTGKIKSTVILNSPSGINPGNLGAVITSGANFGSTTISRGHKAQQNVFGTGNSIQRYYDIAPANNTNLNATLRLYYFDNELNGVPETGLSQWRSQNNINWVFMCSNTSNSFGNYVESGGISSMARWTLAASTPPLNVSIPPTYTANPGGAANTIYIGYGPASITLNAQVTGGAPPYSYKWTIGSSAGPAINTTSSYTVSPSATTTYYLNVKDAFGCAVAAITRQVNVVDIRCGANLSKVTVCKFQNGNYNTVCVTSGSVAGLLSSGSYLGPCNSPIALSSPIMKKSGLDEKALNVTAFPNPSENYFNLIVEGNYKGEVLINVYNIKGSLIYQAKGMANRNYTFGNNWISGVYLVQVRQGTEMKALKLIKQ
ncbi:T9SS type A sorting domain-containing protein [Lacibacter sediminis]|uniref:T9SS type A sorting domain-containing protein n=1 Tax=Lacibacter sediminis TaxID=2760713 RepID=A0A7G5XCK8_9BACT|nr:T9SS type A sorting domain-containing protein [Lacibacter sediminis]QNA43211.1 T9SS type A sorting domain-containing protein [Lacibacter sediminis]